MVSRDSNIPPGFVLHRSERNTRLLLPISAVFELEAEAELATQKSAADKAAKAMEKSGFIESKLTPQHPNILVLRQIDFDLRCIRTDTKYDLSDAKTLASLFLKQATIKLDRLTSALSNDLLVAVSLTLAYEQDDGNLIDVLDFLRDPRWDCAPQIFTSFVLGGKRSAFEQTDAAKWLSEFSGKTSILNSGQMQTLVDECYRHWTSAGTLGVTRSRKKKSTKTIDGVQVFVPDELASAAARVKDMRDDRRDAGTRILQNAHRDHGNRTLPDAKAAHARLELAKLRFENLAAPIERLQIDLVLAGAMQPRDFRITPLLLLGVPGIGKTFLAMQLAAALGVATEQISAGGAQGGFQLTGSHSSWTGSRPGKIFALLAGGESAAPVVVIDEVDKIRDAQYPVLPVLLDLLDPGSSKQFNDEFFELRFDASRIIIVLTANSIEHVPPALLSRVEVFNVPAPAPAQRRRIIEETSANLRNKTKRKITFDEGTVDALAERIDIDLRRVTRLIEEAFARAMRAGGAVARIAMPNSANANTHASVSKQDIVFH